MVYRSMNGGLEHAADQPDKIPAARPSANPASRPERARAASIEQAPARIAPAAITVAAAPASGAGWPAVG